MKESPWHLRLPTTEHYQWFRNIMELHQLTQTWQRKLQIIPSCVGNQFEGVDEALQQLEPHSEFNLENILDDSQIEELLNQYHYSVWLYQALSVKQIGEKEFPLLKEISWSLGKLCAEKRWAKLPKKHALPLRKALFALQDSPLSGYPHREAFLIKRSIDSELQIELKHCPHQSVIPEVKSVADLLCTYHSQWMQGFAAALNPKIQIEHQHRTPRCLQRWFFNT